MTKPGPPPLHPLSTEPQTAGGLVLHRVVGQDAEGLVAALHDLVGDKGCKPRFPGPNPVSLERRNLAGIDPAKYWVCEKTDGTRFALVFCAYRGHRIAALMDRKMAAYLLPIQHVPKALFQGTVLDGEVAYDKSLKQHQFLVFDAVIVSGIPVFHKPFSSRLAAAALALRDYAHSPGSDALHVLIKCFYRLTQLDEFTSTRLNTVRHHYDVDGVVLSPEEGDVVYGRHMKMFKFKPFGGREAHTVDFLVGKGGALHVYDTGGGGHVQVGKIGNVGASEGDIAECTYVDGDVWKVKNVRTDKTTANDLFTYQKTLLNIRENLSLDSLKEIK